MDWIALSLVSAVAFPDVTIAQKRILGQYVRGAVAFKASASVMQVGVALVLIALSPPA